jgi:hypothetical protein
MLNVSRNSIAGGLKLDATRLCLTVVLACGLVGCGPRGETKTLAEILQIAKADFAEQFGNGSVLSDTSTQAQVSKIHSQLEALISDQSDRAALAKAASDIAHELASLTSKAGYTSRPALTELATQFREMTASAEKGEAQLATLKLMATRTYSTLASELATTKFSVMPLSPAVK